MADIYVGLIIVYCFSLAMLLVGVNVSRRSRPGVVVILLLMTLALMFYSGNRWHDNIKLASAFPVSNLLVVGDVLPLEAGLLVGLAWPLLVGRWRKIVLVTPLILICVYQMNWPLFANTPEVGNRWRDGVCWQTSQATCGPAAAATLLQYCNIPASEEEMAKLCFTTTKGTSMLGLYRGLKIKTRQTPWGVVPFQGTLRELQEATPGPVLLSVGVGARSEINERYIDQWGWIPNVNHTVVLFRFVGSDRVEVGDPAVGREMWSLEDLAILWRGTGIYVGKRPSGDGVN